MTSDIDTDRRPDAEWQGTADATLSDSPTPSLYELSGLNPKYWEIVGLDITTNSHGNTPAFTFIVYAVDRRGGRAVEVDADGRVAVRAVWLNEATINLVAQAMGVIKVRLRGPDAEKIKVVAEHKHGDGMVWARQFVLDGALTEDDMRGKGIDDAIREARDKPWMRPAD
ncbi:hypothetical protein ACTD5D_40665 [Nocardia takedensis]|uniref:hypothetical protein n=1 Tax=Nocardia takedensis TaxID=259390 RepID=UPI003F758A22